MTSKQQPATGVAGVGNADSAQIAELDRLGAKLERLSSQRGALRKAIEQFGENFDVKTWMQAFDSPDPDDINRVFTVTGGYLALVNNMAEAVRVGAKLAGLKSTQRTPGLPGVIDAIRADGGFSDQQAQTFTELYRTRNRLQHSSPDIDADEVHLQVRLLLNHLPRLIKSYLAWLRQYDIQV